MWVKRRVDPPIKRRVKTHRPDISGKFLRNMKKLSFIAKQFLYIRLEFHSVAEPIIKKLNKDNLK